MSASSDAAIKLVQEVLDVAQRKYLPEAHVVPDVEEGSVLYFFGGEKCEDGGWSRWGAIMIAGDGEACLCTRDRFHGSVEVTDLSTDANGLDQAMERIHEFLSVSSR